MSSDLRYVGNCFLKFSILFVAVLAFLMMEIVSVYSSFLSHGFYESLKNSWDLPLDELKQIVERIEKL